MSIQPPKPSDSELVVQAQNGDKEAFDTLMQRHTNRAYSLGFRMTRNAADAQEIVQNTFLAVFRNIKNFRGEAQFTTWLTRIATNQCLNLLKKRRNKKEVFTGLADSEDSWDNIEVSKDLSPWQHNPEEKVKNQELQRILAGALTQLSEKYRLVILLRDVHGLSTKEAAETLKVSESNVKIRLMRGRLLLKDLLAKHFKNPKATSE